MLDLTNEAVRRQLGIPAQELTGERLRACQAIATLARRRPDRFGGILAPSAADPDGEATTLVIFAEWRDHVVVTSSRVLKPAHRLLDLYERLVGSLPLRLQDEAMRFLRQMGEELRKRLPH